MQRTFSRNDQDRGVSMVEILVSVVLLGTVVVAVLTTIRASVTASALNRDHANAHAWLQTATNVLYGSERVDCGTELDTPAQFALKQNEVWSSYDSIAKGTSAANPEGWPAAQISVVFPVEFWDGDSYQSVKCYDDFDINLQLITLQVAAPDGRIVESVQMVKG